MCINNIVGQYESIIPLQSVNELTNQTFSDFFFKFFILQRELYWKCFFDLFERLPVRKIHCFAIMCNILTNQKLSQINVFNAHLRNINDISKKTWYWAKKNAQTRNFRWTFGNISKKILIFLIHISNYKHYTLSNIIVIGKINVVRKNTQNRIETPPSKEER